MVKVSTLLTTYNAEDFLKPTLQSVEDQTFSDMEILVWDDFSQDNTRHMLREYKENSSYDVALHFPDENKGPYVGLNKLLEEASGDYIAIQDHDDIWHPQKIEQQVRMLDNHSRFIGCGTGRYVYYEALGKVTEFKRKNVSYYAYHTSSVFRNAPGIQYDETVDGSKDMFFQRYVLGKNQRKFLNMEDILALSRVHDEQTNLSERWRKHENFFNVFWKHGFKEAVYSVHSKPLPTSIRNFLTALILRRRQTKDITELREPWSNYIS